MTGTLPGDALPAGQSGSSSANASTSLFPLPPVLFRGLTAITVFGFLSFISSSGLFLLLGARMLKWKRTARSGQPMNQFIVLILNLLLADIQQSTAFIINTVWLIDNRITVGSRTCWAQGFFISNGDMASGVWCTAIGIHTFASVIFNYRLKPLPFYLTIAALWLFVYACCFIAVGLHPTDLYVRAGAWCWVDQEYPALRLWLHYFWVFVAEFGVVIVYACLYIGLWSRIRSNYYTPAAALHAKQAARLMALYPAVYVCCTLPLASARMVSIAGHQPSYSRLCVAGAMITSNGFLDVLVYTLTRRISLFSNEAPPESNGLDTFTVPFFGNREGPFGTITTIEANGTAAGHKFSPSQPKRAFFNRRSLSSEHSRTDSQQSFHSHHEDPFWTWDTPSNVVRTQTTVQIRHEPLELRDIEALRGVREAKERVLKPRSLAEDRESFDFYTRPEGFDVG